VNAFLRQAEEILEIAMASGPDSQASAIVIDRQGGMRMLDGSGWTLPALQAEFGAVSAFKVERRVGAVRVEGLAGTERCLLQRTAPDRSLSYVQPAPLVYTCVDESVAPLPASLHAGGLRL
jgi:hypothetical protein